MNRFRLSALAPQRSLPWDLRQDGMERWIPEIATFAFLILHPASL